MRTPIPLACECVKTFLAENPGSKMFARYGIVDRANMAEALKRSKQWEREQRKPEFEHSSDIASTQNGAISESRPSVELN
jgi:hypothetical protein